MNEFLNPKSMVTPGAVGAMVMLITNALCSQFPEIAAPRWTAFILSFLFATFILSTTEIQLIRTKVVFWLINSLIIFSVSIGTNNIGVQAESSASLARFDPTPLLKIGIADAAAQESTSATVDSSESNNVDAQNSELPIRETNISNNIDAQNSELLKKLEEKERTIQSLASENKKLKEAQKTTTEAETETEGITATDIQEQREHRFFKEW